MNNPQPRILMKVKKPLCNTFNNLNRVCQFKILRFSRSIFQSWEISCTQLKDHMQRSTMKSITIIYIYIYIYIITNQKWRSPNFYLTYTHILVSFHLVQCKIVALELGYEHSLNFLAPPILGPIFLKAFSQLPNPLSVIFPKIVFLKLSFVATMKKYTE